jgi:DNA mismatch repair protein MutL
MPIHILPEEVAAKIAAGEVIERPASVVKELIENGIDAGATTIHVEIQQAGRRLIRVSDDGCGIPSDEVEVAFARHATSKLQTVEDLNRIRTLGFRGEALASIAAVARVTLITRADDGQVGTRLRIEGTRPVRHEPGAHPRGTTVSVENLFYNVPARLKFLKKDATERRHIDALVTRYAMAYPHLRFSLENDDRLTFHSPGSGELFDVLIEVYGLDIAKAMMRVGNPVDQKSDKDVHVWGYVSQPDTHRGTRDQITLFVNGRWIQDRGLTFAVEQAYHTLLPSGRHPLAVLSISLPPNEVDVNVHPAKSEVHFQNRNDVFRAVQRAVRNALIAQAPIPDARGQARQWGTGGWQERRDTLVGAGSGVTGAQATQAAMDLHRPAGMERDQWWFSDDDRAPKEDEKLPPLRVIGQLAQTYILAEGPQGLYLIDQHAAHERIMYEKLLAQHSAHSVQVQRLLEPLPIELTPGQADEIEIWLETLNALGFEIEPFGGNTVLVRAVPALLARADIRMTLTGVLDELAEGQAPLAQETHQRVAAAACKRGAVKAGQTLSLPEGQALIAQLEETTSPRTCPHGRPTMILLSQGWMEREFGRR